MHNTIQRLMAEHMKQKYEWAQKRERYLQEGVRMEQYKDNELLPCLRDASPRHYKKWLRGYLAADGKPTHYHDYNMPDDFYIAKKDFTMKPLYGSLAVDIIVPKQVNVTVEGLGHCSLYFMNNYTTKGLFVPVYKNTIV